MGINTILLEGEIDTNRLIERDSAQSITPGELCDFNGSKNIIPHGNAGQNVAPWVAIEDMDRLLKIGDDYSSGETTKLYKPKVGDLLYMFLKDGENVSFGDFLESDGAGALQAHTPQAVDEGGTATYTIYTEAVKFQAWEDLDLSGGGTSRGRIKARCIG